MCRPQSLQTPRLSVSTTSGSSSRSGLASDGETTISRSSCTRLPASDSLPAIADRLTAAHVLAQRPAAPTPLMLRAPAERVYPLVTLGIETVVLERDTLAATFADSRRRLRRRHVASPRSGRERGACSDALLLDGT